MHSNDHEITQGKEGGTTWYTSLEEHCNRIGDTQWNIQLTSGGRLHTRRETWLPEPGRRGVHIL